jgi:hypothetical protein
LESLSGIFPDGRFQVRHFIGSKIVYENADLIPPMLLRCAIGWHAKWKSSFPAGSMPDCWSVTDKIGHRPDHLAGLLLPDESQGQPGDTG